MLTEYTAPGESIAVRDDETIYSLLNERITHTGANTVIAAKKLAPGMWQDVHAGDFDRQVRALAKGFMAFGIERGDAVTIFSSTRYEWGLLDFALAAIGAVSVPIYDTDSALQARDILIDSDVKLAIADDQERFDRLDSVFNDCEKLERILMIDSNALGALEGLGVMITDDALNARIKQGRADDLATIVYTSGSTGKPKGVELTHRNFVSIVRAVSRSLPQVLENQPRFLLFLPLAHCFARFVQYFMIASDDGVIGYLPDTKTLLPDVRSFEPTFLLGVPRVFEKIYNAASRRAGTGMKGRTFAKAAEAARVWARKEQNGERHTAKERAQRAMYEASVYHVIRTALGPRMQYVCSGGAPLDPDLAFFFCGIDLPMIQGYGLTETAAPFTFNRIDHNIIGTVGQPVAGSSVRLDEQGELQVKGPNVFRGYHNLPEATKAAFTEDGWMHTGDLASIDDDGFITITGRAKDIIITAGGKNVSPIPLEQQINQCPIVDHAVVVGDNRPFIGALITLDEEGLRQWLPTQKLDANMTLKEAAFSPEVAAEIQKYVDQANEHVSRAESVRKFVVLDQQFTQDNGCLTPSLKIVRPRINKEFALDINDRIYNDVGHPQASN